VIATRNEQSKRSLFRRGLRDHHLNCNDLLLVSYAASVSHRSYPVAIKRALCTCHRVIT